MPTENVSPGENGLTGFSSMSSRALEDGGWRAELAFLFEMIVEKKINMMLVLVPLGFIVVFMGFSETVIFVVNFLAMVVRLADLTD